MDVKFAVSKDNFSLENHKNSEGCCPLLYAVAGNMVRQAQMPLTVAHCRLCQEMIYFVPNYNGYFAHISMCEYTYSLDAIPIAFDTNDLRYNLFAASLCYHIYCTIRVKKNKFKYRFRYKQNGRLMYTSEPFVFIAHAESLRRNKPSPCCW